MSKREETNTRISPRALQKKLSAISRQRSVHEGSTDSRKVRGNSTDELNQTKGSRFEKSISIDDRQLHDKYTEFVNQLSGVYEDLKRYALSEDIRDKLADVVSEDREEEPHQIMKCMKYIMAVLVEAKQEDKPKSGSFQSGEGNNDYEELLQKAENDIRQHIRIEQQMKLLIDGLQAKVDEYEKDNPSEDGEKVVKDRVDSAQLLEMVRQKEEEIANMQKTIKQKDETIKSLEEKVISMTILEHTIKSQKESHKKDKESIRNYYEQELANVTKEIQHIQRVLAINLSSEDKVKLLQEELLSSNDFNMKKVQLLETRVRQLTEPNGYDKEDNEHTMLYTDPGFDDRRYSVRPSATTSSIMKSRGYDLKSHRASTDMHNKNSENRPQQSKQTPPKKKRDIINELKSTTILGARFMAKNNAKDQPQQGPSKTQKDNENYLNYLKRKMDNASQNSEKEREHLRSFDARRSNSVKKGVYLAGAAGVPKEKSVDRTMKMDMSRTQEGSESLGDKHTKSVPKLLKSAANTMYGKILKH